MSKRKLTDTQIANIAISYANGVDAINLAHLSSLYHVSASTISKSLHYAISNCLVDMTVARLIAEKAIRHDNIRRENFGYAKSNKISDMYNDLINNYIKKEVNTSEIIEELNAKYAELKFQFDIFDDVYSSSDEYPYTKKELEDKINLIEKEIKRMKGIHN